MVFFSGSGDRGKGGELKAPIKHTLIVALVSALIFSVVPAAYAEPTTAQQAAQVKREVDALAADVEVAAEDYNDSRIRHDAIVVKRDKAATQMAQAQERIAQTKDALGVRVSVMYRTGQYSFLDVLLGASSFDDFAAVWDLLNQMNKSDSELVADLNEAHAEYEAAKAELDVQEKAAAEELAIQKQKKESIEGKLAERKRKLDSLNAQVAAELAAQRRREAEAAARATFTPSATPAARQSFPAATNRPRSEVVSIAMQYRGVPYVWGGMSPSGFDCSGLTAYVYRAVGVSLPHSSRAQINYGQRVNPSDLQAGDLVFFGSPIHHVGIYIGGGQYIHAPTFGDVVKVSNLGAASNFSGAARP